MRIDWSDPLVLFNAVEAAWWLLMSGLVLVFGRRWRAAPRWVWLTAIVSFFLFGISDLIEIRTGAWWRPPTLFLLKAACLSGIVVSAAAYLRSARAEAKHGSANQ